MKALVQLLVMVVRHLPPMEIRNHDGGDVAARQSLKRLAGRFRRVRPSQWLKITLLLLAVAANILAALGYVELAAVVRQLMDLTQLLAAEAIASQ